MNKKLLIGGGIGLAALVAFLLIILTGKGEISSMEEYNTFISENDIVAKIETIQVLDKQLGDMSEFSLSAEDVTGMIENQMMSINEIEELVSDMKISDEGVASAHLSLIDYLKTKKDLNELNKRIYIEAMELDGASSDVESSYQTLVNDIRKGLELDVKANQFVEIWRAR